MKPNSALLSPVLGFEAMRRLFLGADQTLGFAYLCTPRAGGGDREEQQLRVILEDEWPTSSDLSFLLYASPNLALALREVERVRSGSGREDDAAFAKASADWLREKVDRPFEEMDGLWLRSIRLVVSGKIPIEGAVPTEAELDRATQASRRLETGLAALDLHPQAMDHQAFVTVCSELLNRGPAASWRRFGRAPVDEARYLNEQLLDLGSQLTVDREGIDLDGGTRLAFCSPKGLSEQASFGLAKFLVADVLSGRRGIRGPFLLAMNVHFPDASAKKTSLAAKRAYTVNAAYGPLVKWLPAIATRHQDFETLFASVENGHRVVQAQIALGLYGRNKDDAARAVSDAVNYWAEHNWVLLPDRFIALPLLITSLPLGADRKVVDGLGRFRTMTTEHAAVLAPIFGTWRGTGTPILTPIGRDGQLMSFDLFDSKLGFNAVCAGETGSGKSFLLQLMTSSYLQSGAHVWTIDVGGSYRNLCERMEGEYIDFEAAGLSLNPFRLVSDFHDESDILEALIAAMAAPASTLTDFQRAALSKALRAAWDAQGPETTIDDVARILMEAPDQRARDVGEQLYAFTGDGQYGRYFSGANTITFRNRYTVLELGGLQSRKHLQRIVLLQLIYQIQQSMRGLARDRRKLLFVDEAWELLTDGEVGRFIEHGYRRFRKQRGAMVIATQSLGDLYNTEVGVAIAENSAHKILLKQQAEVIDRLLEAKRLSLGEGAARLLKSVRSERDRYSEVFFQTDQGSDVGRILVDPATRLLFSTNAWDVEALDRRRRAGMGLDEAVADVLAERARPHALAAE